MNLVDVRFNTRCYYLHKKTGHVYMVSKIVKNCTNKNDGELLVIYKSAWRSQSSDIYARELNEFRDKFEPIDIYSPAHINELDSNFDF